MTSARATAMSAVRLRRRTLPPRGGVECRDESLVDEVDLHGRDATLVVAHEAAAAPEALQLRVQAVVARVHVQQAERPSRLGVGLDAEAEVGADQVLELVDVSQRLRGE